MTLSPCVIDTAHWDWPGTTGDGRASLRLAMADGVVAVIAKATQGRDAVDAQWANWVAACHDLGLLVGAYHFASNTEPGEKQAGWFLDHVERAEAGHAPLLVALDFERNPDPKLTMTLDQARAFCRRVKARRGCWPLLYGDVSFHHQIADPHDDLGNCPLWPAMYGGSTVTGPPVPPAWSAKGWTLWQFTDGVYAPHGLPKDTPGFKRLDRSAYKGSVDELRAAWPTLGG